MARYRFRWFLLAFLCYFSCTVHQSGATEQCPAPADPTSFTGVLIKDRGGLNSLVKSSESTRNAIITEDLPFEFISEEFRKV